MGERPGKDMLCFDENALRQSLTGMAPALRLAFATAAAARQLPAYEAFAERRKLPDIGRPREVLEQLWEKVRLNGAAEDAWDGILDDIMDRIPAEDPDADGFIELMAQQAMSSLAYAIRCLLSAEAQEAAWAGLCEYEAADQAAIKTLAIDPGIPGAEAAILSHDYVQRTLRVQLEAMALLDRDEIDALRASSALLPTFTADELARFAQARVSASSAPC